MSKPKKLLGVAVAALLATGAAAALVPTSAEAVVTNVGSCSGLIGIGAAKSTTINPVTTKSFGLTDVDNRDISIKVKGMDPDETKPVSPDMGDCTFASGLSTPDSSKKPVITGYSGTHQVVKWSSKLFSPELDCDTTDTTDATEWPANGKLDITFADLNTAGKNQKLSAYVTIDGFTDPDDDPETPSDVVELHGLVIKGVAAGADVSGEVYFEPVFKDKTQTAFTPVYFGYQFDLSAGLGCTTPTQGDAEISAIQIGDGTSPLLSLPASGISFSIGQP
jgi:hypothetical protein